MPRKINVTVNGEQVEATAVVFETMRENWNAYRLPNGDIIEVKILATEIFETGKTDPKTQEPIYILRSQNIMRLVQE